MRKKVTTRRVLFTSFFVDVLDILINLTVAIITGSVVMIAETLQGIADLASVSFLLIGHRRAKKPADKEHPLGYGREVYFWTLIASILMLAVTASYTFYIGLDRLLSPEPIDHIQLAYAALILSIVFNGYALSVGLRRLLRGRHIKKIVKIFFSTPLLEVKAAFILDLIGTSAALIGLTSLILYAITGNVAFDGIGAMGIGLALGGLSLMLLISVKDFLIGRSASPQALRKIKSAALSIDEVRDVLDLKTLHIGPGKLLVNIKVHLKDDLTTDGVERVIDEVKEKIAEEVGGSSHIQVEAETPHKELVISKKRK